MSFQDDLVSLHDFLMHTSEKNLKQMLIDGKMTDVHVNLLMKIVKSTNLEEFKNCYEKKEFPKVKMNPKESALKENFWETCSTTLQSRGLIGKTPPPTSTTPPATAA
jgi:hypothetical protein